MNLLTVRNNRTILIVNVITMADTSMAKNDKNDKSDHKSTSEYYIVKMLEGIPEDLVDLFTPNNEDELDQLEINVAKWLARSQEREKIMRLQKRYGLPLRPNQSLRDLTIRLKILELKKRRKFKDGGDYSPPDEGNAI